jgi:heme A synthase
LPSTLHDVAGERRLEAPSFARYAWGVLAYNVAVVLWGAFVRASGSGAGCGNHWPLCNGQAIPPSPTLNTLIEFTHRATSGIDLVLVALLVVWAFRAFPKHHPARLGATLSAIFLITEALIGAALVLLEHVAANASANRAWSLSTHLVNTLTLLACLTLTAWWAMGNPRLDVRGKAAWMAAASLAGVMLLGVSGAIAALGDTLFPARSLAQGFAQDFDASANIFLRLRVFHPFIAAAVGAWLIFFATSNPGPRAYLVLALLGAQLAAGVANLLLMAPVWMQLLHLLLADAFWIALVLFCADLLKDSELRRTG